MGFNIQFSFPFQNLVLKVWHKPHGASKEPGMTVQLSLIVMKALSR